MILALTINELRRDHPMQEDCLHSGFIHQIWDFLYGFMVSAVAGDASAFRVCDRHEYLRVEHVRTSARRATRRARRFDRGLETGRDRGAGWPVAVRRVASAARGAKKSLTREKRRPGSSPRRHTSHKMPSSMSPSMTARFATLARGRPHSRRTMRRPRGHPRRPCRAVSLSTPRCPPPPVLRRRRRERRDRDQEALAAGRAPRTAPDTSTSLPPGWAEAPRRAVCSPKLPRPRRPRRGRRHERSLLRAGRTRVGVGAPAGVRPRVRGAHLRRLLEHALWRKLEDVAIDQRDRP